MREQNSNPLDGFFNEVRRIVREEIAAAMKNGNGAAENEGPQVRDLAFKDWLNANEAAQLYGLPKTWFEERGRAGDIARAKPGRHTIFQRRDIEAYLERNKRTDWPKRKTKK